MLENFFSFLNQIDTVFWGYVAFCLIAILGGYLTVYAKFYQVRAFPTFIKTFVDSFRLEKKASGTHPAKLFFASVGGMVGIGNVVGIVTAVQIGGPGALFWVWCSAFIGGIVKYCEVFLGLKTRIPNGQGGYDGGPMLFLRKAFKVKWIGGVASFLLCIYGVEIYQFSVIADSFAFNWEVPRTLVIVVLLLLVFYAASGGVKRVAHFCSMVMPGIICIYFALSFYIIFHHLSDLPSIVSQVFQSAFIGHAPIGGFAGSTLLITLQQGVSRAAYSADIGIGYDTIIQCETQTMQPSVQARLAVFGIFMDNFICSLTILVVLLTGLWKAPMEIEASRVMQQAFAMYFPGMRLFIPLFFFIVGMASLTSYFCVGLKCARFLSKKWGEKIYILYAICSFSFFAFCDQSEGLLIMSLSGASLLVINLLGIFLLRKHIVFDIPQDASPEFISTQS